MNSYETNPAPDYLAMACALCGTIYCVIFTLTHK